MHHQVTVPVAAPPSRVWAILTDVERWPSWTASMRAVAPDGPLAVGTRVRVQQPRLPAVWWKVTEVDPGRSFTWEAVAPGSRSVASHRVDPRGEDAAQVTLTIDWTGPVGRIVGWLYRGLTTRYVQMEADGLAAEALGPT